MLLKGSANDTTVCEGLQTTARAKNTLLYTKLIAVEKDDQFTCKVAKGSREIQELIEDGFEFVCSQGDLKFLRKRK